MGAGNPKMAGVWLQVALVVVGALGLLVLGSWLLTGQVRCRATSPCLLLVSAPPPSPQPRLYRILVDSQ